MAFRADHCGYCSNCLTNVEHDRAVKSVLLQWIDRASFRIPELFGLGPWYCVSCGKRSLLFPPFRRNVGSYDPSQRDPLPVNESDIESVGNVYFSAVSLVHRSNRAKYYSEKFRDGIAESLLSCSVTFSQVRQSLGITDLDLQDWISRYHQKRLCLLPSRITSADEFATSRTDSAEDTAEVHSATADSDEPLPAEAE